MIKVAYKLVNGIILIPVTANEQEGFFAFDTGAMQTAVNKAYFPELQGEQIDIAKFSEEVKESTADKGVLASLRFSEVKRADLPVVIMDLMYVENALKTIVPDIKFLGTLGVDVIGAYTIMLDYNNPELLLDPTDVFDNKMMLPMEFGKLPVIKVNIAGRECDFVLDTGANTCLLGQSFMDNPQLITVSENPHIVTIPCVRVGDKEYSNITAAISDISEIQKRVPIEGVIGYQILSTQRTILDFKENRIIFEVE